MQALTQYAFPPCPSVITATRLQDVGRVTDQAGDGAEWVVALMTRRGNKDSLISALLEVIQCDGRGGLFTAGRQDQGQRSPPRL